jgi:glycosyltransferase involved in cell wall biosynthesis
VSAAAVSNVSSGTILVLASTFPASATDPVPAFVRDQVVAIKQQYPQLTVHVLAPHDQRSATATLTEHADFVEHRFHYFWPRSAERLAGRGIMPALRENAALFAVVPFLFLGEYFATARLVRRLKPDLIYAHWFTPQAVVASWVSRRAPFVFTTHASDVDVWRRIPFFGARIVRSVSRKARAITAVSSRSKAKLTRFFGDGVAPEVHIVPMGVELPDVSGGVGARRQARNALGLGSETVYLFIGRIVEKKGLPFLLDALASRHDALGDWTLLIAGDGPLRAETEAYVAERGLSERVRFLGFVSGDGKEQCFRAADVMVVPSIISSDGDAEGLPVALLEGLAFGLPCVATDESGADDILTDGVDGFVIPQKDSDALASALVRLHTASPAERTAISDAARSLSARFSWPEIARRHVDLLFAPLLGDRS